MNPRHQCVTAPLTLPKLTAPSPILMFRRMGILGGMGPAATIDFMSKLVKATPASRDQDHIPMVVYAVPQIPDRTAALLDEGPSPFAALCDGLFALQRCAADFICIPCNTAHEWYERLSKVASVPILHIVDAVVEELQLAVPTARRIGLMATSGTICARIYQNRAPKAFEWELPTVTLQTQSVMAAIAAVKCGNADEASQLLRPCFEYLVSGQMVDAIVLGCTELPLISNQSQVPIPVIDSTNALARVGVRYATYARVTYTPIPDLSVAGEERAPNTETPIT